MNVTGAVLLWSAPLVPAANPVDAASESVEASAVDSPSLIAPLANRSLLLDGARAGARLVAVGERGHVLLSDDGGAQWRQVAVPTSATLTATFFVDERSGWAVGHDAVILHTSDGGETWELQYRDIELESPLLDVWFSDPAHGFAVGAYGLFLETRDAGATWERRQISEADAHFNSLFVAPDGTLYIAGEFGTLLKSSDSGVSWSAQETPYSASFFGGLALSQGDVLVFGLRGNAYRLRVESGEWQRLQTNTQSSLMAGWITADGQLILGGADGVMCEGDLAQASLAASRRADRGTIAAIVPIDGGGAVLLGAFGIDELRTEDDGRLKAGRRSAS